MTIKCRINRFVCSTEQEGSVLVRGEEAPVEKSNSSKPTTCTEVVFWVVHKIMSGAESNLSKDWRIFRTCRRICWQKTANSINLGYCAYGGWYKTPPKMYYSPRLFCVLCKKITKMSSGIERHSRIVAFTWKSKIYQNVCAFIYFT